MLPHIQLNPNTLLLISISLLLDLMWHFHLKYIDCYYKSISVLCSVQYVHLFTTHSFIYHYPHIIRMQQCEMKSMEKSPWEGNNCYVTQEMPVFYGTQVFVTMFTTAHHCTLSWSRRIQSTSSNPISLWFTLILYSHLLCLDIPSALFISGFPAKIVDAFVISLIHATCPIHLTPFVKSTNHEVPPLLSPSQVQILCPAPCF